MNTSYLFGPSTSGGYRIHAMTQASQLLCRHSSKGRPDPLMSSKDITCDRCRRSLSIQPSAPPTPVAPVKREAAAPVSGKLLICANCEMGILYNDFFAAYGSRCPSCGTPLRRAIA